MSKQISEPGKSDVGTDGTVNICAKDATGSAQSPISKDEQADADLAEAVGATLARTVLMATCGGLILGWLPGVLLLAVIDFNLSFFGSWYPAFGNDTSRGAVADLAIVALSTLLLILWRSKDAGTLERARSQIMNIDPHVSAAERNRQFETPTLSVGWSSFVQGVLIAWMLTPVLTTTRTAVLTASILTWLLLDSWDMAPFTVEVMLARVLGIATAAPKTAVAAKETKKKN